MRKWNEFYREDRHMDYIKKRSVRLWNRIMHKYNKGLCILHILCVTDLIAYFMLYVKFPSHKMGSPLLVSGNKNVSCIRQGNKVSYKLLLTQRREGKKKKKATVGSIAWWSIRNSVIRVWIIFIRLFKSYSKLLHDSWVAEFHPTSIQHRTEGCCDTL